MRDSRCGAIELSTRHLWDGAPVPADERTRFLLTVGEHGLGVSVDAPYRGDPAPPGRPGPLWGLWEYEVAEIFIVGEGDAYTEIELGPHGHHLVLRFKERRKPHARELPLEYQAVIEGARWRGEARVPWSILPSEPLRANVYTIHGRGEGRRYLAAYPVPGTHPDFHRLEYFRELRLDSPP